MLIEAKIIDVSNGEECRKSQQALTPVALEIRGCDEGLSKGSRWMEDPKYSNESIKQRNDSNEKIDIEDLWH